MNYIILEAKKKAIEAYETAQSADYKLIIKDASKLLMMLESNDKNYKEALAYSKTYIETKDSLFLSEKMLELGRLEAGYTFDKEQVVLNEKIKQ